MRTLIINSMFASSVYRRCAEELGAVRGMELTVLTVDAWRMNGRPMPFDGISASVPYATVLGKTAWRGYENRGFYRSGLRRAFQLSRPEVLFLMEEPFSIFAAEILLAKAVFAPKIPVVFFTWNNLSLAQFDYRPSFFYRTIAQQTLSRMHYALTANSDGIAVLRKSGFKNPIRTIGYGVDSTAYQTPRPDRVKEIRAALNISYEDIVVGYVGRMLEMKGVDLLIEAYARLKSEHPGFKTKLLLIGSGEAEQSLLQLARERGISFEIRHIPSVPHQEVPDYMHTLDILVLPSRRKAMWAEQFGRVLVEAMAAGKIVIGSSSGAIPEVIGDGGFIFPENDSAALTASLHLALTIHPEERALLLGRAHTRAKHFSWQRFARDAFEAIEFCYENRANSYSQRGTPAA
jgi:glycosyltransferase involved in cell wall biosynthesis